MASLDFGPWLTGVLDSAGIDGEVFGGYISGTLDTLEGATFSEVEESLLETLQGCLEDEAMCLSICKVIQKRWEEEMEKRKAVELVEASKKELLLSLMKEVKTDAASSVDTKEDTGLATFSSEEKMRLLAQYGCESEGEDDGLPTCSGEIRSGGTEGVFVNHNTSVAGDAQKLHRELLRAEHEAKIEGDRKDRETQKRRAQERKEKEKKRTHKQEKRR